jgi:hypothetical protein
MYRNELKVIEMDLAEIRLIRKVVIERDADDFIKKICPSPIL